MKITKLDYLLLLFLALLLAAGLWSYAQACKRAVIVLRTPSPAAAAAVFSETAPMISVPLPADSRESIKLPILMYHGIAGSSTEESEYFIKAARLESDLKWLRDNGYTTILPSQMIAYAANGAKLPQKPIILSFDDGYCNNYTYAFPLLQKYNAKATIFVIPKAIGTPHKMTAEQIYELSQSGLVSIQSHTYSHGNLSTMDEETLVFEMEESQKYLAALTGQVPYAVCYPEGTRSELSIEVAGRYYEYGLLMNGQLYNTSDDPLRVKRFYVPRGYDLGSFRWSVQEAGTSRNW